MEVGLFRCLHHGTFTLRKSGHVGRCRFQNHVRFHLRYPLVCTKDGDDRRIRKLRLGHRLGISYSVRLVCLAAFKDKDNALRQGWREGEGFVVMIAAVHDTFQKHVVPHVNNGDGFMSTTNWFWETVFRYMHACFDRN